MSESLNHSFNRFVQTVVHSGTTHEWVIESFIPPICSKQLVHSETTMSEYWNHSFQPISFKTVLIQEHIMSESMNHSFHRFVQNSGFHSEKIMSESLNHSFNRLFKTVVHSGTTEEWVINHCSSTDSFNHASATVELSCPSNKIFTIKLVLNIFIQLVFKIHNIDIVLYTI